MNFLSRLLPGRGEIIHDPATGQPVGKVSHCFSMTMPVGAIGLAAPEIDQHKVYSAELITDLSKPDYAPSDRAADIAHNPALDRLELVRWWV